MLEQLEAYVAELQKDRGLRGVIVTVVNNKCLDKLEAVALERKLPIGVGVFLTSLRSTNDKSQSESLLRHGFSMAYHKNQL